MGNPFEKNKYLLTKKVTKPKGTPLTITDTAGHLCFYVYKKGMELKEDIRVYTNKSKSEELLVIKARKALDISSDYDVFDSKTGERIAVFRRRGLKSTLKDEWVFMDACENEIGLIQEDNWFLSLSRRFTTSLLPQVFEGFVGGNLVFNFRQGLNPFVPKLKLDFGMDKQRALDRRLGIAAAVLISVIERRQFY